MKQKDWAVRCMHEAKLHEDNTFVTLTYADDHLPEDGCISKREVQLFLKRLRKEVWPQQFRYYAVGEYGETTGRPHYHLLLFGLDFEDKIPLQRPNAEHKVYSSRTLERLWPQGYNMIGTVTWQSAMYVCKYVQKKLHGDVTRVGLDPDTGEWRPLTHEFALMSRRPALGKRWFEKYGQQIVDHDSIIVEGKEVPPPKYYDRLRDEREVEAAKARRKVAAAKHADNNTAERLRARERVAARRAAGFK